jgi:hypothetical protein
MKEKKIVRTGYISELDLFLKKFDVAHPDFGASRKREIEKSEKIAAKRDGIVGKPKPLIWEKF